jgi:hypothetical protein
MQASDPARRLGGVRVFGRFDSQAPVITSIFSGFMKFRRRGVTRAARPYFSVLTH